MSVSVFLFTSPYPDTNLTTERRKIRQINKVYYRKLSINRFYLFSANCLNSTNLVQWHIVIALIINTNIPKAKIDVRFLWHKNRRNPVAPLATLRYTGWSGTPVYLIRLAPPMLNPQSQSQWTPNPPPANRILRQGSATVVPPYPRMNVNPTSGTQGTTKLKTPSYLPMSIAPEWRMSANISVQCRSTPISFRGLTSPKWDWLGISLAWAIIATSSCAYVISTDLMPWLAMCNFISISSANYSPN